MLTINPLDCLFRLVSVLVADKCKASRSPFPADNKDNTYQTGTYCTPARKLEHLELSSKQDVHSLVWLLMQEKVLDATHLLSRGMKMSTTLPYLSKSGMRSSAVVRKDMFRTSKLWVPARKIEPSCCILGKTTCPSAEDGGLTPLMGQGLTGKEEHKEANAARRVPMNIPENEQYCLL
jgi:hypothetical protein